MKKLIFILLTFFSVNTYCQYVTTSTLNTFDTEADVDEWRCECFTFPNMYWRNRIGNFKPINGSGFMVTRPLTDTNQHCGIISPVIDSDNIGIKFKYKFSNKSNHPVWFKILINNQVVDSVGFNTTISDTVYTYDKKFKTNNPRFVVFINFQGRNGPTRIGVDDVEFYEYENLLGCSILPIKVKSFKFIRKS